MKRLLLSASFFYLFVMLFASGCQNETDVDISKDKNDKSGVEVAVVGGGQFPKFLVGKWKADNSVWKHPGNNVWEFVFEPDGTISSAVINTSSAKIIPGKSNKIQFKHGRGLFEPGLWTVEYNPKTRELFVSAVIEYMHLELEPTEVKGKTIDLFRGSISEDGKTWMADWFTCPDYWVYAPGSEPARIGTDEDNCEFVGVTKFDKVE